MRLDEFLHLTPAEQQAQDERRRERERQDAEWRERVDWYTKHLHEFLHQFWAAGNADLKMEIDPHDCATGCWFAATWTAKNGRTRRAESMRHRLLWERVIGQAMSDGGEY